MNYLKYVNIKQGTDSRQRFSNGNTLPLTALPHALAAFAPQTNVAGGSWFYHPKDRSFEGVRLTHQPSPWVGDFSHFVFMPSSGEPFFHPEARYSLFRPEDDVLMPHYMQLRLLRYRVDMCLAPTDSGAAMELSFEGSAPRFNVYTFDFPGEIEIDCDKGEIRGFTTSKSFVPDREDFRIYFIFRFDCGFEQSGCCFSDSSFIPQKMPGKASGTSVSVLLKSQKVSVKLATSYLGYEQAELNLCRELDGKSFTDVKRDAENIWEKTLSLIEIEDSEERMKTFYSCLYRAFLYPTKFYETDETGHPIHVNPETGEVREGVMYLNNGFWDTYRTVYPLYSLICPDKYREIVQGFLNFYDDTGYLPRWPSPSEFGIMPGTLIEPILADAVVKDILDKKDSARALEAVLKNATVQSENPKQGRKCVADYRALGYVPKDKCKESVNETLDCAYGDFCIARIAEKLGVYYLQEEYDARAQNYRNLFDAKSGFMRGKNTNGNFDANFDPFDWGGDYTEGSAWQSSFNVPHDPDGLASLYGGKEQFLRKLDEVFATPPIFNIGSYGREIHEMSEMAAVDLGQCAISNQPSFHLPFFYAYFGEKEKTFEKLQKLWTVFSSEDDGFAGDEDNGTMSAWYIFSVIGLYPLCPGKGDFVTFPRLVKKLKIKGILYE